MRIAAAATNAPNNPVTVANRVERLSVQVRGEEKALAHCARAVAAGEAAAAVLSAAGGPDPAQVQVQPGRPRAGESPQEARVRYGLNMAAHAVSVEERLAAHRADLAHWQAVRSRQLAGGTATDFGRHNVAARDRVRVRDVWYPVVRANAKTVTVFGMFGPRTTPWQEVQARQRGAAGAEGVGGKGG